MAGKRKARRAHGEGSVYRHHADRYGCPPVDPDTGERPEHPCTAPWVGSLSIDKAPGQKRSRKTFTAKTQREVIAQMQAARADTRTLTSGQAPTLEAWLNHFIDVVCVNKGLKIRTVEGYRGYADRYLIPYLGSYRLDRLQTEHIRGMYTLMRAKGLSETTCNQAHRILSRALNVALSERRVAYNVAAVMADKPQATGEGREGLTLEDARAVLAVAGEDPRPFVALYLGLRQGECLGLRWSDIDLAAGNLSINRKLTVKRGGGWVLETPKTRKSRTTMPIPKVVLVRLKALYQQHANAGGDPDGFVFGLENGAKPMGPKSDYNRWCKLLKAAGVEHHALHAARNTTATLLKDARVPVDDRREIMRHTSQAMTEHYTDELLELKREGMARLEAHIAGTTEPEPEPVKPGGIGEALQMLAALSPAERAAIASLLNPPPAIEG